LHAGRHKNAFEQWGSYIFAAMINSGTLQAGGPTGRRAELDWLRVASVSLVFLHHVCMPFNGDHFHIMNDESSKVLDDIMVYFEQWRLPLLLLISGAGTVMAFSKHSAFGFVKERSRRLLLPLIVGVLVIVPPQTYFELKDQFTSYLDFYTQLPDNLESNHLWFIQYLFFFSLIVIPLVLYFRSERSVGARQRIGTLLARPWAVVLLCVPIMALQIISLIYFPDGEEAWINFPKASYYFYFFVIGIILFSCPQAWNRLALYRKQYLTIALISLILFYGYYYLPQEWIPESVSAGGRWSVWFVVCALVGWTTMLTVMAYAQVYLNQPRPILKKLNEAVYPFYILHQTVIVVLAYYVVQWEASIAIKLIVLLVISLIAIIAIYRLVIYPFNAVRLLFGMKKK
jgi:peptidoglycan/LPS O-acetylase OafA/YrhL